ncbi:39S ribosomal protein L18, mitochondrial-like [Agrilus planipennis]|uniref:Large ribosomal subunit protein uL18m n=1 Tax=Agrilus planipennis TaxID=224129 RepID=A0A1W4XK86_AGRPL|nr:39S ribosomal protein L18, mitochondrial [Agrilus planipennis]XP_025837547.1 39S ribosomal protein L18, mitochondrial-like [Agrilus planipennis]
MVFSKINKTIVVSGFKRFNFNIPTNNDIIPATLTNRNPRNLEKLRIAYKPSGYHVDRPGKSFWHKLKLIQSQRHITASIYHFQNGEVLSASTKEWAIKKQLNKTTDSAAYYNIGRVLAQRCLECGLIEISNDYDPVNKEGKVALLLKALEESGISLTEPVQFQPYRPWDQHRPEKPWDVIEDDIKT